MTATPQDNTKAIARMVLASSSPRRQTLLAEAGYAFDVQPPPISEPTHWSDGLPPIQLAEALAYFKARSVADNHHGAWVLGADTIVALDEQIMGKPADEDDARRMLHDLSHNRHDVITGVALVFLNGDGGVGAAEKRLIASSTTRVTMRPMTDAEIDAYIVSDEWRGKAGAYAIQETADRFISTLEGSFSNVVGLPMELLEQMVESVTTS